MPVARPPKRALVAFLLSLAATYGFTVSLDRDSADGAVVRAVRRVLLRIHPDKGGNVADTQKLNDLKDKWEQARRGTGGGKPRGGRKPKPKAPPQNSAPALSAPDNSAAANAPPSYRIQSLGALLTYHNVVDVAQWRRFVTHVESKVAEWGVRNWCATLERTKQGRLHIHLMMQYNAANSERFSAAYTFEGLKCNVAPNDLLGEGFSRRKMQESIDRGMFYVYADKLGTERDSTGAQCTAGNYFPCWTDKERTYVVKGRWAQTLWQAHKLSHAVHEEYIFLCREGVLAKKRNLDAVREREAAAALKIEIDERTKRIRENPSLYRPFPVVPAAVEWLKVFTRDAMRYPILIVVGPSMSGKTEWAKSLFRKPLELKIGSLEHFPERMRSFVRGEHDGLVLDDIRDLAFLVRHQDKLQGKYDAPVEFASTPGGGLAYFRDLYQVPVVATANRTTANLHFLEDKETNDFLGDEGNRVVVHFPLPAAAGASSSANLQVSLVKGRPCGGSDERAPERNPREAGGDSTREGKRPRRGEKEEREKERSAGESGGGTRREGREISGTCCLPPLKTSVPARARRGVFSP